MKGSMLYAVSDGVATITFNRPAVMNALDAQMIRAFRAASVLAAADRQARVIVLPGAGPAQAYAETKALANRAMHAGLAVQLDAEALAFARCAKTEDFAEGVAAFTDKRKPQFQGK